MNRFEWAVNIQRDSYASYIGHYPLLSYFAIAENESIGRQRYTFMQVFSLFYYHLLQFFLIVQLWCAG
jgi:splicing factor 3B subunit 5